MTNETTEELVKEQLACEQLIEKLSVSLKCAIPPETKDDLTRAIKTAKNKLAVINQELTKRAM